MDGSKLWVTTKERNERASLRALLYMEINVLWYGLQSDWDTPQRNSGIRDNSTKRFHWRTLLSPGNAFLELGGASRNWGCSTNHCCLGDLWKQLEIEATGGPLCHCTTLPALSLPMISNTITLMCRFILEWTGDEKCETKYKVMFHLWLTSSYT